MPIAPSALASLASHYTKNMTSIRGRRVQRLVKREFAGADHVLLVRLGSGVPAVLGISASGAALCATDGTGTHAPVFKWSHDSTEAIEIHFDLHKDSLPILATATVALDHLRAQVRLQVPEDAVQPRARAWVSRVLQVLA
jgi:hypothetical protein